MKQRLELSIIIILFIITLGLSLTWIVACSQDASERRLDAAVEQFNASNEGMEFDASELCNSAELRQGLESDCNALGL